MKMLTAFDTSISTDNLGDEIIMDAVYDVLRLIAPNCYVSKVATHDYMGERSLAIVQNSSLAIVGGTNILDANMFSKDALWKLRRSDGRKMAPVVLLATGWRRYGRTPDLATRRFFDRALSHDVTHSVRDSHAEKQLRGALPNVVNTACVTMWGLTPNHCAKIPESRAGDAVTTLTHYDPNPDVDRKMLRLLQSKYQTVHFWSQQFDDLAYFESLGVTGVRVISPSTQSYTAFLDTNDVDFVGTRLHGGIRALQRGHRAVIIAVDNRAAEIGKDTNLPVVGRSDINALEAWIDNKRPTTIELPSDAISRWKLQFKNIF